MNQMNDLTGKTIGGYPIEKPLGPDGYGLTYLAQTSADPIAVKILREDLHSDKALSASVLAGWEKAKPITHKNLTAILGCGEDETYGPYCLLELSSANSLRKVVMDGSRLNWRDCLEILNEFGAALKTLHQAGLQHGDLCPSNVYLTIDQDVKIEGANALAQSPRAIGSIIKNPALGYMAPERLQGAPATPGSDCYGIGGCFFFMLAMQDPFPGKEGDVLIQHILTKPPLPLETLCEDLPPQVIEFINRLMAKDPTQRYASVDDVLSDVAALKSGKPLAPLKGGPPAEIPQNMRVEAAVPEPVKAQAEETSPSQQSQHKPKQAPAGPLPKPKPIAADKFSIGRLKTQVGSSIPMSDKEKEGDDFFRRGLLPLAITAWETAWEDGNQHAGLSIKLELGLFAHQKEVFEVAVNELTANIQDGLLQAAKDSLETASEAAGQDANRIKMVNNLKAQLDQRVIESIQKRKTNLLIVIVAAVLVAAVCIVWAMS